MNAPAVSLLAMSAVACGGSQQTPPAAAGRIAPRSAADLVRRVQQAYQERLPLTCRFRQTTFDRTFGLPATHDGTLHVERPGKVRWDYFSKRDRTHVVASQVWYGQTIQAVSGKWHHRVSQSRSTLPISIAFLNGSGELASEFDARLLTRSAYGDPSDSVLELTPKRQSPPFRTLILVVDPATSWVKRSIVTTATGDTNEFAFFQPNVDRTPSRARR